MVWTGIIATFTIFVMAFFPSLKQMGEGMEMMMKNFPDSMKEAMGMTDSAWSSVLGFYSTYYSLHIMVLSGIFAMSTASGMLAKEEKEHTAEFLYTRPLKRSKIYTSKGLSLLTMVVITLVVQTSLGAIGVVVFGEGEANWMNFTKMHVNGAALVLFFACLGYFLATVIKPKTNFMGVAVGAVFGGYLVNALSKTSSSTEWVGYFSPFKYIDFTAGEPGYDFSWAGIAGLIGIGIILVFTGARFFNNRDFGT